MKVYRSPVFWRISSKYDNNRIILIPVSIISDNRINHPSRQQQEYIDQAAMLTQHKQTPLFKVTKLTRNRILPIIFTLKTSHPARSAINCDVYVGGKVRVLEFMIFLALQQWGSK